MNSHTLHKLSSILISGSFAMGIAILWNANSPASAQTCVPLRVVDGKGATSVRKRISQPGIAPGVNNNWNTDFAVPAGRRFTSYIATITPENNAGYNVALNLKYSDNTAQEVYKQDRINLRRNVPYRFSAFTPAGTRQPYQVNLTVSGTFGNTYQARVAACQD